MKKNQIANSSIEELIKENNAPQAPSREELNVFLQKVAVAAQMKDTEVEAPRRVIEHYNPGTLIKGFDSAGYFVFSGVKVFEEGKMEEFLKRDARSMEEVNHGGR